MDETNGNERDDDRLQCHSLPLAIEGISSIPTVHVLFVNHHVIQISLPSHAEYSHPACRSLSTPLPLSILLLHPLLILGIPLRLLRIRHVLDPASAIAAAAASFDSLAALRVVVLRLLHGGLAVVLPGSVDRCAVGGVTGCLLRGAVAGGGCAVGGGHVAAAGEAEGGGAGEVGVEGHGCGGSLFLVGLVVW
jgi:hypothetical protein